MAFKKEERIKERDRFEYVFKKGRKVRGTLMRIMAAENREKKNTFGFVAGVKTFKTKVERNRTKRRVQAAMREYKDKLNVGFDIIIHILAPAVEAQPADIKKEFGSLLRKLNLIKEKP